jgi:N utilization substance protein A
MSSEMALAIRQIIQERGISEELVMHTIEDTLLAAYKRKYGTIDNAVVRFAEDATTVSIYAQKKILAESEPIEDPALEISLEDARTYNDDAEPGDELLIEINPRDFDRVSIQSAKQKARQSLREIQKDTLYSEFKDREGELIVGYYQRERNGTIFVDLGRTEGILPRRYQSPREIYRPSDRVRAMIYEVEKSALGLQIVLTRTHTDFVKKIFELEVPEIYDRTIEIHKMVREPGYRTKMSVYSTRDDVDPVGACVGMRGVRIQTVVRELEGEKIDVLRYDPDARSFITEALKPAEVEQVIVLDEGKRQALAVVPESQFSLAIGKQGLNVRLANRLTDWSIDVRTRAQVNEMDIGADSQRAAAALFGDVQEEITDVAELPGIVPRVAAALKASGVELLETLVAMDEAQLRAVRELSEADIGDLRKLIEENVEIVEEEPSAGKPIDDEVVPAAEPAASVPAASEPAAPEPAAPVRAAPVRAVVEEAAAAALDSSAVDPADAGEQFAQEVPEEPEEVVLASELPGLPEGIAAALMAAGLDDVVELVSMSEAQLGAVEGLSGTDVVTLLRVIEENVEVVEEDEEEQETPEEPS